MPRVVPAAANMNKIVITTRMTTVLEHPLLLLVVCFERFLLTGGRTGLGCPYSEYMTDGLNSCGGKGAR